MSDGLPADLSAALEPVRSALGAYAQLRYIADAGSTNDIALALAAEGAPEGTAILADAQHAGRGRRGRSWFSPPGAGIYLSTIVRLDAVPGPLAFVTVAAGVAAAEAVLGVCGLPVELKWPNDVVVGRPWRKLAGVLCESAGTGGRVDTVVVGIGINLRPAAYPPEIANRATSIETELGRAIDRAPLVIGCLSRLSAAMDALRHHRADEIVRRWRQFGHAGLDRAPVRWRDQSGERRGRAIGIDDDGALIVSSGGGTERVIAGEVEWETLA